MKILLVEDNVSLCRNIASVLQNEGYTVVTCSNGNVAEFQMLNNSSDLILLDRMLPGKDGITLTREARAAGITVPILLLTALDTLGDKVTGLDAGADDYIVKPFAMEELLLRNAEVPITRNVIFNRIWGPDAEVTDAVIDTYIHLTRQRLAHLQSAVKIQNSRGTGYQLSYEREL